MKKSFLFGLFLITMAVGNMSGEIRMTLNEAVMMAQTQSPDAAVALNQWRTAYWEYRSHQADYLPEITFTGSLPSYYNNYAQYRQADGSYTYLQNNLLGLNGQLSVKQNIPLTGGSVSFVSSLDFSRQLGDNAYNEYMSIPVGLTLSQPLFTVNDQKWARRIEPVRYQEAKAAYMESVEGITLTTISYFFDLLLAGENLQIAQQNLENANKLYEIAVAKRKIGQISQMGLMQLKQSSLLAKANLTDAQSNRNAMMFQLIAFLGMDESETIEPVLPNIFSAITMDYAKVLQKAQENNALSKNIQRRQLESQYAVADAKGDRYQVHLSASVGYTGKDNVLNHAYQGLRNNQIVEMGVSIPIVDWGKSKGKIKIAESNRDALLSQTKKEQLDFNQDIFLLVEQFNNQSVQLEIAKEVDTLAQERYQTSIETFMVGQISILDLNDAQSSKDEARQKYIEELFYYWYDYYQIRSITLYDFLKDTNIDADLENIAKND